LPGSIENIAKNHSVEIGRCWKPKREILEEGFGVIPPPSLHGIGEKEQQHNLFQRSEEYTTEIKRATSFINPRVRLSIAKIVL